jgi:hypothetical protein
VVNPAIFTRFVICVVLLTFASACSTTRPLAATDSKSLASQIAIGDTIELKRNDGSQLKFKVTEVSPDGLRGRNVFVPFTDIGQVQISESMNPAGVVFLVVLGAVTLYMLTGGADCTDNVWSTTPCIEE